MNSLQGTRILVTHSDAFMGPAICANLESKGATVIASRETLIDPHEPAALIAASGQVDVVVINLSITAPTSAATDILSGDH